MIAGATLYITATNAGAVPCAIPRSVSETVGIGIVSTSTGVHSNPYPDETYLTFAGGYTGSTQSESDFRDECKNYTRTRLVFRQEIRHTHEKCAGIGDVCLYSGSAGCGIEDLGGQLKCNCEIEFTYCAQTSTGIESESKVERSLGK